MNGVDVLRIMLVVCVAGMFALAMVYLAQRKLAWHQYLGWGLVALIFPLLGPFLVIANRPGVRRARPAPRKVLVNELREMQKS